MDTVADANPFSAVGLSLLEWPADFILYTFYPGKLTPAHTPLIFLLGLLCGCGIATFSVGTAQVSYWFPKSNQGKALGIFAGIGNLAPGIFSFLLPLVLNWVGMTGAYLVWLVFLAIGALLYSSFGRNAPFFQLMAQGFDRETAIAAAKNYGQEMFPSRKNKESLLISARN